MKSIGEILDNYGKYETFFDDWFGKRFSAFLTDEQVEKIGFEVKDEFKGKRKIKEWTEKNIISQLTDDLRFGWECCDKRDISSELMADVVWAWCKVLENGLENTEYGRYGDNVFKTVAERYGVVLDENN